MPILGFGVYQIPKEETKRCVLDAIKVGYPIWWAIATWPVNNFVKDNDFTGKTVIPFATFTSSGLGQRGELLEEMANGGNWQTGKRFSSQPSDDEIKSWASSL